jgi:hypothetical protein
MRALLPSLFVALCLATPGFAQVSPEPHGKRFRIVDDVEAVVDGLPRAAPPLPTGALEELRQRVDEEEQRHGAYSGERVEGLVDLAAALEAAGDVPGALRLREQALHLIRVNEGLYSPTQGPVLRALLDSFRQRGDLEALDERYEYFFRLYGRGERPRTRLRWAAAMEYFAWQREAVLRGIDGDSRRRLLELYALQDELLEDMLVEEAPDWRQLRDVSLSQLATLYLVDDWVEPIDIFYDPRTQRMRNDDPMQFDPWRERLEGIRRSAQTRGVQLIEAVLERIPDDATEDRAVLRLALADWFQWQGATRSARERYVALWTDLHAQGREDLAREWLGHPRPLPDADVFALRGRDAGLRLTAVLDVSDSGRARVLELRVPASREREAGRLSSLLRDCRFRPAFRAAEPVDSEGLVTHWELFD